MGYEWKNPIFRGKDKKNQGDDCGGFFWGWGVENSMHTKNNTQTILKSMFEFMLIKWLRPMHGYGLRYIVEVHSWGIWFLSSCDN